MRIDARLIRTEREKRGWTQEHLAAVAGLGLRTVQRIESRGISSLESARALSAVLGVSVAVLRVEEPVVPQAVAPAVPRVEDSAVPQVVAPPPVAAPPNREPRPPAARASCSEPPPTIDESLPLRYLGRRYGPPAAVAAGILVASALAAWGRIADSLWLTLAAPLFLGATLVAVDGFVSRAQGSATWAPRRVALMHTAVFLIGMWVVMVADPREVASMLPILGAVAAAVVSTRARRFS